MNEKDVFKAIETTEKPSSETKKEIFSEIELIQNTGQIVDLFISKYLKTIIESIKR